VVWDDIGEDEELKEEVTMDEIQSKERNE